MRAENGLGLLLDVAAQGDHKLRLSSVSRLAVKRAESAQRFPQDHRVQAAHLQDARSGSEG